MSMTDQELRKSAEYIWRKDDPEHRARVKVTQITRNLVRAVNVPKTPYGSFWNPIDLFLEECTPLERASPPSAQEAKP